VAGSGEGVDMERASGIETVREGTVDLPVCSPPSVMWKLSVSQEGGFSKVGVSTRKTTWSKQQYSAAMMRFTCEWCLYDGRGRNESEAVNEERTKWGSGGAGR
jgi:hypothetical protein